MDIATESYVIPSLDVAFDAWVAALAKDKPLQYQRLLDGWHQLLTDKTLDQRHRNPLYVRRSELLSIARMIGYQGRTQ
jgi:hypothetical protein